MAKVKTQKNGWYFKIVGDVNDADYRTEEQFLEDSEKKMAFWLFRKLQMLADVPHWNDDFDCEELFTGEAGADYDWEDLFYDQICDLIPCDDQGPAHTITEVSLTHIHDGKIDEYESIDDNEVPTDAEIYNSLY